VIKNLVIRDDLSEDLDDLLLPPRVALAALYFRLYPLGALDRRPPCGNLTLERTKCEKSSS
jgi:hypothetical protein